jgi:DNA-binding MarR family transcriptional regulator
VTLAFATQPSRTATRARRALANPQSRESAPCRGGELLRTRDLELLAWSAEQYAARVDQLTGLIGCGPRTVQRALARLRAQGLIETFRMLADQPAWVTPTVRGLRACGSPYGVWRPRLSLIAHVAAVNDARLHVQARDPNAQWISERLLAKQRSDSRRHLPDAVVMSEGRQIAIEVELTVKSRRRLEGILDQLARQHDATVYFCAPAPHRVLSTLAATGRWPALGIRPLPTLTAPTENDLAR